MNNEYIETILARHNGLRRAFKKLDISIKNCDKSATIQMLDAKTELENLNKTKTINYNDWDMVNMKLRELGNKFTDNCVCNMIKSITKPKLKQ